MRRYVHQYASGVWVDSCEVHGVWLDRGELERLEAYAEAAAAGMSPTDVTKVARPDVGVAPARIVTSPDASDERAQAGPAQSTGTGLDWAMEGPFVVFGMLGQVVDGVGAWRRLGSTASSERERKVLDEHAREDGTP